MNIIKGEKFQELCDVSISKDEHKKFEAKDINIKKDIDVDTFDFTDYDNPELIYCNVSLLNTTKQVLLDSKLLDKLKQFKNPFKLVLHNADDAFGYKQLQNTILDIPNCKQVYSVNADCEHPNITPLPIGQANYMWTWGNEWTLMDAIDNIPPEKDGLVYANFTMTGEVRAKAREECYQSLKRQGVKFTENQIYPDYLQRLSTFKYCTSPKGNGVDCYRMWEALYLKVVPICERSILVEEFAKTFPIKIVDTWDDLDVSKLEEEYANYTWENYDLLDFDNYIKHIGLK